VAALVRCERQRLAAERGEGEAGSTRRTPNASPKMEYSVQSSKFCSTVPISPHPSSLISPTPYQPTPAGPTCHPLFLPPLPSLSLLLRLPAASSPTAWFLAPSARLPPPHRRRAVLPPSPHRPASRASSPPSAELRLAPCGISVHVEGTRRRRGGKERVTGEARS
jgi:hypothetical protein